MRLAAVLDGTIGSAERQARALGAFLREGVRGDLAAETVLFFEDEGDRERLVALSPTRDVRLIRASARRPEPMVGLLEAVAHDEGIPLFVFPAGQATPEMATRLACRTHGAVLTDALSLEAEPARLICRKNVYSNHLVGRFELATGPWCVTVDACWNEAQGAIVAEHRILSDTDGTGEPGTTPFGDVELIEPPATSDLAASRFLVVAGYGTGSREGTERIARAARRMGACFGVSRPVAMNAWAPMDRLIGVSGTRAAPALCIVAGASGAPALHWGIEKAGFIVAVNPDEQAPIVANSDAALLDDGVAVVEELADIIAAAREAQGDE